MLESSTEADLVHDVEDGLSAFAAAFGVENTSEDDEDDVMDLDHQGTDTKKADWARLVDAPSHQLPQMSILCRDFLRLLTAGS